MPVIECLGRKTEWVDSVPSVEMEASIPAMKIWETCQKEVMVTVGSTHVMGATMGRTYSGVQIKPATGRWIVVVCHCPRTLHQHLSHCWMGESKVW